MSLVAKKSKKNKKKSGADAAEEELKTAVEALRARLADVERSLVRWRQRATDRKAAVAEIKAELKGLRRRLAKAEASAAKWRGRAKAAAPAAAATPAEAPVPDTATEVVPPETPDDSWTVTRLRAEARARGVAGYSRKSKAELLALLQG